MIKVGVLGTGAYGLALGLTAHRNGHKVTCYTKLEDEYELIKNTRKNEKVLPGIKIPCGIEISNDLKSTIEENDFIVIAIPVPFLDNVLAEVSEYKYKHKVFCIASKGISFESELMVNEIIENNLGRVNISAISGPSFAIDIANNSPIGLSVYGCSKEVLNMTKEVFKNNQITLKETNDLVSLELGGAVKNVLAVASGMIEGLGLTDSAKALFLTNILNDFMDIMKEFGGKENSIFNYCCFGDLIMTCNSHQSRNYSFGYLLGQNRREAMEYLDTHTVEGVNTLKTINSMLDKKGIYIPVIQTLYTIVFEENDPKLIINYLIK